MRNTIALPALQVATAAFFATAAQAETYCVTSESKVVDPDNCPQEGNSGNFFLAQGPSGAAIGDQLPQVSARMADSGYVSGGFGKRDDCDTTKQDCGGS
ncbi:uncharacterized protein F4822DRAFT_142529 [Hypoxylon trugodes]|uniref:uncharacterized protein n=1 Tax=Hypoxylon trugodes TaxID=326681 RepID=UPI0021968A27|nr:uncharacterized protein F4822DRAFT_142529 [Hypoxylon trugodes]KAI1392831.1 hypothetical protein F4822DRAFT_142529 [Hypoxylon trugodes]